MDDSDYDDRFIILSDSDISTDEDSDSDSDSDSESDIANDMSKLSLHEKGYAIMSIDIGIYHLGVSITLVDENFKIEEIIWIDLIDITQFNCPNGCELYHTKTFTDWLEHVFQREYGFFDLVDFILIERQPPVGLTAIEQLIFYRWRDKSILISPNSVHAFFCMGNDYDKRKELAVRITRNFIPKNLQEQLEWYDRQHDIADSILFTIYWCEKQKQRLLTEHLELKRKKAMSKVVKGLNLTAEEFFDGFRYIPMVYE